MAVYSVGPYSTLFLFFLIAHFCVSILPATSDGTRQGLDSMKGGVCATQGMKVVLKVGQSKSSQLSFCFVSHTSALHVSYLMCDGLVHTLKIT